MSDDRIDNEKATPAGEDAGPEPAGGPGGGNSPGSGPKFTKAPDPLASVKKGTADVLDSMEGKTVSMKVYVGTIIGVVVLMMLARCGG